MVTSVLIFLPFWIQASDIIKKMNKGQQIIFKIMLALQYLSFHFKIGAFFPHGYSPQYIGISILIIPIIIGFFIGLWLKIRSANREEYKL